MLGTDDITVNKTGRYPDLKGLHSRKGKTIGSNLGSCKQTSKRNRAASEARGKPGKLLLRS